MRRQMTAGRFGSAGLRDGLFVAPARRRCAQLGADLCPRLHRIGVCGEMERFRNDWVIVDALLADGAGAGSILRAAT
jgi:hypothetical protein